MDIKPLVIALMGKDGTLQRVETGAHAAWDAERDEVVLAFKDVAHADTFFRLLLGDVRRAERGALPRDPSEFD